MTDITVDLQPLIDEAGDIRVHGMSGIDFWFQVQDCDDTPLDASTMSLAFVVDGKIDQVLEYDPSDHSMVHVDVSKAAMDTAKLSVTADSSVSYGYVIVDKTGGWNTPGEGNLFRYGFNRDLS